MKQPDLDLPFVDAIASRPDGPVEPLFWFKRFRILSHFTAKPEDLVREIEFHEGLNIVWSHAPKSEVPDAQTRTAGHAGGKTTLCRLLSGLLGEKNYMDEELLESIRDVYEDGWFAAEVRVDGVAWCVARAFKSGAPLAEKMESLDEFLRAPGGHNHWNEYRGDLQKAAGKISSIPMLPGGVETQPWSFFPWFVRDQDSQFSSVADWVDSSNGGTGAPSLSETNKSLVIRSVFDDDIGREVALLDEQKKIADKLTEANQSKRTAEAQIAQDEKRLSGHYPDKPFLGEGGALWIASEKRRLAEERINLGLEDSNPVLDAAAEACTEAEITFERCLEQCIAGRRRRRELYDEHRELFKSNPSYDFTPLLDPDDLERIVRHMPDRRFCCADMALARLKGCELALATDEAIRRGEELDGPPPTSVEPDPVREFQRVSWLAEEAERDLEKATADRDEAKRKYEEEREKYRAGLVEKAAELGGKIECLDRMRSNLDLVDGATADFDELTRKKNAVAEKLKKVRKQSKERMADVCTFFDQTVQHVYGAKAKGIVDLEDGIIRLDARVNDSNRKGAALKAANVVCFDLALLALSTGGLCRHPRFLVHDGPRVADVTQGIYDRYFEFAAKLADRPGKPNFQYILTTTTDPPEKFRSPKYVVCELDASTAEGRLLRRNLT